MNATAILNGFLSDIQFNDGVAATLDASGVYLTNINDTFDLTIFAEDDKSRIGFLANLLPAPPESRGDIMVNMLRVNYDLMKIYGASLMIAPKTNYVLFVKHVDVEGLDSEAFGRHMGEVAALGTALHESITDALKTQNMKSATNDAAASTDHETQMPWIRI